MPAVPLISGRLAPAIATVCLIASSVAAIDVPYLTGRVTRMPRSSTPMPGPDSTISCAPTSKPPGTNRGVTVPTLYGSTSFPCFIKPYLVAFPILKIVVGRTSGTSVPPGNW